MTANFEQAVHIGDSEGLGRPCHGTGSSRPFVRFALLTTWRALYGATGSEGTMSVLVCPAILHEPSSV